MTVTLVFFFYDSEISEKLSLSLIRWKVLLELQINSVINCVFLPLYISLHCFFCLKSPFSSMDTSNYYLSVKYPSIRALLISWFMAILPLELCRIYWCIINIWQLYDKIVFVVVKSCLFPTHNQKRQYAVLNIFLIYSLWHKGFHLV